MKFPDDRSYTVEHEWALAAQDGTLRVGITDHAQQQLGDIVFVSLPKVGAQLTAGSPCGELESTKSVSDLYAPVTGTVTGVNGAVETAPELINSDPYLNGWMFELRPLDPDAIQELLSASEYRAIVDN